MHRFRDDAPNLGSRMRSSINYSKDYNSFNLWTVKKYGLIIQIIYFFVIENSLMCKKYIVKQHRKAFGTSF